MKKFLFSISFLLFAFDAFARFLNPIFPESLTVLNSSPSYKRPCVVASERQNGVTSLQSIFKKMNQNIDDFYCRIGNSPDVRLLLFKPKNFNQDSASSTLTETITSRIKETTELKIKNEKHLIIAGYKVLYPNRCLGRECDTGAYGGCINWCNLSHNGQRRADVDLKPSTCRRTFGDCDDGSWAQDMAESYGRDVSLYANGLWFTLPWVKYMINDDLNGEKIPFFNSASAWDYEKSVTIAKADEGTTPETGQYRAKIVVEDGAALEFNVEKGAKLTLRYLDIQLNGRGRLHFCGKGTVVFTAVRVKGGAGAMIEVCQDPDQQPRFYFSPNRDNRENSYGLELHATRANVKRFVDIRADQTQTFFKGMFRDDLRLVIPSQDGPIPAPFYDAEAPSPIRCNLVEEWDHQNQGKCILQSKPPYESSDSTYYILQHFGITAYSVNQPAVRKMSYDSFPRLSYQASDEWRHFPISVKKGDFYFDAKGRSIKIKEESEPIDCNNARLSFTRRYCDAVQEATSRVREVIANANNAEDSETAPPVEHDCEEDFHWETAISQCMPDEPPLSPPPDCGEAIWDAATEDCECEEGKIYNGTTKRCEVEEVCTVDCDIELPEGDEGAETAEEDEDEVASQKAGGCALMAMTQFNGSIFIFLLPLLILLVRRKPISTPSIHRLTVCQYRDFCKEGRKLYPLFWGGSLARGKPDAF